MITVFTEEPPKEDKPKRKKEKLSDGPKDAVSKRNLVSLLFILYTLLRSSRREIIKLKEVMYLKGNVRPLRKLVA